MAERLAWWVIPSASAVLLAVLCLGSAAVPAPPPGRATGPSTAPDQAAPPTLPERFVLRDASGRRTEPVALSALAAGALVLQFPAACAGRVGQVELWRTVDGVRGAAPFRSFRPQVRADSTLPIAGLPAGNYDVAVTFEGPAPCRCICRGAVAPGTCVLTLAAAHDLERR